MAVNLSETTDRFCKSCGDYATLGYGSKFAHKQFNPEGVEGWLCDVCWDYFIGPDVENDSEETT